ncbi:putative transcription factor C2C2-GATA family [Dioscorea sansibarensis]
MLHQTLSIPLHPCSTLRSSPLQQQQEQSRMEMAALKGSSRPEMGQQHGGFLVDEVAWAVERGNLLSDEFSVDDLLDLGADEVFDDILDKELGHAVKPEPELDPEVEDETENSNSSSGLSFEAPIPSEIALPEAHDAAELEWVSRIMDDTYSEYTLMAGVVPAALVQPVSLTPKLVPVKAKRSKRARTAGWVRSSLDQTSSSSASSPAASSTSSSSSSSSSSSCLIYDFTPVTTKASALLLPVDESSQPARPKKRGRKPKVAGTAAGASGERRCSHCGAQKTPQWRAGPMGAKTLCNACGVRFKSGRLLPEYRPACSPTFISHVHSNSHRKVLEMRRKKAEEQQHHGVLLPCPVSSF